MAVRFPNHTIPELASGWSHVEDEEVDEDHQDQDDYKGVPASGQSPYCRRRSLRTLGNPAVALWTDVCEVRDHRSALRAVDIIPLLLVELLEVLGAGPFVVVESSGHGRTILPTRDYLPTLL